MSLPSKKLCKWSEKTIKKNTEEIDDVIGKQNYYCKNCIRVAKKEKWLCKPIELKKNDES